MRSRGAFRLAACAVVALLLAACAPSPPNLGASPSPSTGSTSAPASPAPTPDVTPPPSSTPAPADPGLTPVEVVLQDARWDAASSTMVVLAFVVGVTEEGGTCSVSAVGPNGTTVSRSVDAYADASVTYCSRMELRDAAFASGSWRVEVSYRSPTSAGTTPPGTVTI